ncbi:hypothetical protein GHT06_013760 [Daphnia sinensis]|uniref:phosphoserine transaminase n=1 Tax=Daphnia sinensis TaxID=1820382 RepID=A0AAD5PXA4_9CRUS|nr:hypothetical protein GHT06_013760 [Daphnia sinensis]
MSSNKKIINFSPGPSKLPEEVVAKVQEELINYQGTGISVMEMSHRSPEFMQIVTNAQKEIQQLLNIPAHYSILFMVGGGTGQFAAVPLNLMRSGGKAVYLNTGIWSSKAAKEASKYGQVVEIKPDLKTSSEIKWDLDPDVSYFYYCSNETVQGVELPCIPDTHGIPLVADMSSNILTKHFDITKFSLVFAGAQKNIGPAGITLVIIHSDLLGTPSPFCPTILNYTVMAQENSLHNTPPCFSLYVMALVFKWITQQGGVKAMEQRSASKSQMIYEVVDNSNGFYTCPVPASVRSRVTIPFRIQQGNEELEKEFVDEAKRLNMIQLKGHRSVGGIRASLYNAVTVEEVAILVDFMKDFMKSKLQ